MDKTDIKNIFQSEKINPIKREKGYNNGRKRRKEKN